MKKLGLNLIFLWSSCALCAQDSTRYRQLELPVVITANLAREAAPFDCADSLQRVRNITLDVGRMLDACGLANVTNYGPAGSASLMRIRGMAPDHTTLTWQGVPLNSVTLGMADCSLIPTFFFDAVRLRFDPVTSSPSSSAIGGAINLVNETAFNGQKKISFIQESNSLNNHFTGLVAEHGNSGWNFKTKLFNQSIDNKFSYTDTYRINHPIVQQINNDGNSRGWMQQITYRGSRSLTSLSGWTVNRTAELPGIMGSPVNRYQLQRDNQQRVQLANERNWSREITSVTWKNSISWLRDEQSYLQANSSDALPNIQSSVLSNQGIVISDFKAENQKQGISASAQGYIIQAIYDHQRTVNQSFPAATLRLWRKLGSAQSTLNSRYEHRPGFSNIPSVTFSEDIFIGRKDKKNTTLHLDLARKIRVPDLNELYWQPGGNPHLLPEKSFNVSSSVHHRLFDKQSRERFAINAEGWWSDVRDWIQWLPGSAGIWSPVNYKRVRSTGGEMALRYSHYIKNVRINAQLRYQHTIARGINQKEWDNNETFYMVYQPRQKWFAGIDLIHSAWDFSIIYRYTGMRYTGENNSKRSALDAYSLIDISAGYNTTIFHAQTNLRIKVDNLLNQSFESVRAYAMPGRVLSVSLSVSLQKTTTK